jgi:hypothetical protein
MDRRLGLAPAGMLHEGLGEKKTKANGYQLVKVQPYNFRSRKAPVEHQGFWDWLDLPATHVLALHVARGHARGLVPGLVPAHVLDLAYALHRLN